MQEPLMRRAETTPALETMPGNGRPMTPPNQRGGGDQAIEVDARSRRPTVRQQVNRHPRSARCRPRPARTDSRRGRPSEASTVVSACALPPPTRSPSRCCAYCGRWMRTGHRRDRAPAPRATSAPTCARNGDADRVRERHLRAGWPPPRARAICDDRDRDRHLALERAAEGGADRDLRGTPRRSSPAQRSRIAISSDSRRWIWPWFAHRRNYLSRHTPRRVRRSRWQAHARPRARSATRPIYVTSGAASAGRPTTASASAICGTLRGLTKLVTSIRRTPAAMAWPISASLVRGRDDQALILQAVARRDLDQLDRGHRHTLSLGITRSPNSRMPGQNRAS